MRDTVVYQTTLAPILTHPYDDPCVTVVYKTCTDPDGVELDLKRQDVQMA